MFPKAKRYVDFYNIILKQNHAKKECHFVKQCWCTCVKLFSARTPTYSKLKLFHVLCVKSSICYCCTSPSFFFAPSSLNFELFNKISIVRRLKYLSRNICILYATTGEREMNFKVLCSFLGRIYILHIWGMHDSNAHTHTKCYCQHFFSRCLAPFPMRRRFTRQLKLMMS